MKTIRGRSSRVLLVAAMTTSAFAGATATAGAAETSRAAGPECDPVEVQAAATPALGTSACASAPALVRSVLVNALRTNETLRVAEASVMKVFDVLHPELRECEIPNATVLDALALAPAPASAPVAAPVPAETVTGTNMATVIGTVEDVEILREPAGEVRKLRVESSKQSVRNSAGSRSDNSVASAVGGVVIEDKVVVEQHAVAPEQMEVVGPATAATGGLPATGHDGSMLTMLGLAMIASGAAARFVARD